MKSTLSARTPCRLLVARYRSVQPKAVSGMYNHIKPNFDYIEAVLAAFPEDAVASPDEARVCVVLVRMSRYALRVGPNLPGPRGATEGSPRY